MKVTRRQFVRNIGMGVGAGVMPVAAFADHGHPHPHAECDQLHLRLQVSGTELTLDVQRAFLHAGEGGEGHHDRFLDINDQFLDISVVVGSSHLVAKAASLDGGKSTFLQIQDDAATVNVVTKNTDDPGIGQFTVWNNNDLPSIFLVDLSVLSQTGDLDQAAISSCDCHGGNGDSDGDSEGLVSAVTGDLNPPPFEPMALAEALLANRQYQNFQFGRPSGLDVVLNEVNWECAWTCAIPIYGILCLFWKPFSP